MAIFLVLPTKNRDALIAKARAENIDILVEYFNEGGFLANFQGISLELAEKIGMSAEGNVGQGIVQPLSGHHGFANKLIWEWVASRQAKENG